MMNSPEISKSSRHSKITGNFGEYLLLYWLSKHGFECAHVDHVGLDIIARNPHTNELMGVSVKTRSRLLGTEGRYVRIPIDNIHKLESACKAFGCHPYFAFVVDATNSISAFILSLPHLLTVSPPSETDISWRMTQAWVEKYEADSEIKMFKFSTETGNWW